MATETPPVAALFAELMTSLQRRDRRRQPPDSASTEPPQHNDSNQSTPPSQPPSSLIHISTQDLDDRIHAAALAPPATTTSCTPMSAIDFPPPPFDFFSNLSDAMVTPLPPPVCTSVCRPLPRDVASVDASLPSLYSPATEGDCLDLVVDLPPPLPSSCDTCSVQNEDIHPAQVFPLAINATTPQPRPNDVDPMPGKVSVLSPQSALFPTLIHTMLDEVRIDITRFYVPLEVVTTRVLVHIQRHLTDLLDKAHDGMSLRRMRQLSCVLGVETILTWLARYGTVSTQGWLRDAILHGRGGERAGPTGPLMLTAINLTGVVVEVQKRVHRAQATAPSSDPPPLVSTLSLPLEDEVGYNQYLHTVYSPRHRTTTKRFADEKAGVVPPPTAMSPRRGLHVLLSEHIYRHEYRTVSKHIPRFSSKSSVIDVADAATRRKRGVRYGNVKGKVHQ